MADPYEILASGINSAFSGLRTSGEGAVALAQQADQRAYRNALIEAERRYNRSIRTDERQYQEQRDERLRTERKVDDEEIRLRNLRNTFSSLGGDPDGLTEQQLSKAVRNATETHAEELRAKLAGTMLDEERTKARALSEDKARYEAEALGFPTAKTAPLAEVTEAIAKGRVAQKIKDQQLEFDSNLQVARSRPEYGNLQSSLGDLLLERQQLIATASLPAPEFNTDMDPEDLATIQAAQVRDPQIQQAFLKLPDGAKRLAMYANAKDAASQAQAFAGIPSKTTEALAGLLKMRMEQFEPVLLKGHQFKNEAAVRSHLARLNKLPYALAENDKALDQLYDLGAKQGINFGLALRFEDRDKLEQGAAQRLNQLQQQGAGAMPVVGPQQPASLGLLPPSGFQPPPVEGAAGLPPGTVEGLFPAGIRRAKEAGSAIMSSPGFVVGSQAAQRGVSSLLGPARDTYSTLFGGQMSDPSGMVLMPGGGVASPMLPDLTGLPWRSMTPGGPIAPVLPPRLPFSPVNQGVPSSILDLPPEQLNAVLEALSNSGGGGATIGPP